MHVIIEQGGVQRAEVQTGLHRDRCALQFLDRRGYLVVEIEGAKEDVDSFRRAADAFNGEGDAGSADG